MKAKAKRGKPRQGRQVREVYPVRLEPERAKQIRELYGDGQLGRGIDCMYELLSRDHPALG
jgi:hypothetical protein